jgi:hypothetical protein
MDDVMTREIPQNEVRTVTHTVAVEALPLLFDKLHQDRNVINIEHERTGGNFKVTVHFAIMDLALQLNGVSASIERSMADVNEAVRVHS